MTDLEKQALAIHDKFQDVIEGLDHDLETGTHHGNNASSEEFAKRYKNFMKAFNELGAFIDSHLPENY
jgi:hypothetical protein